MIGQGLKSILASEEIDQGSRMTLSSEQTMTAKVCTVKAEPAAEAEKQNNDNQTAA
jgi:hypothetical protein